jgi:hypothetical protein
MERTRRMPSTDEIRNEIRKTLSDPTPLYALAGAGDLAYEKLREVPGRVEALAGDRKAAAELAAARLHEAQAKLVEAQSKLAGTVTTLPTDLKTLQEKAQTFALQQVGRAAEFAVKAKEVYDELAERGKVVVEKGRPGPAEAEGVTIEVERVDVAEEKPAASTAKAGGGDQAEKSTAKRPSRARKSTAGEKDV